MKYPQEYIIFICNDCDDNHYYSYKSKNCVDSCDENEFTIYNFNDKKICYEKCPSETIIYNKTKCINKSLCDINNDLKINNGTCIDVVFTLNRIHPTKLYNEIF